MSKLNPTPEEQSWFELNRLTITKIDNGYLCKRGHKQVFCGDLQSVYGFMKLHFESTRKTDEAAQ